MYVLRISRYRECLGHDRWVFDSASMHLLHLNLSHIFMCSLHQYNATRTHFGCECNAHSAQIQCNVGTKKRSERTPNNIIHTHRHNAALEHARPILPEHTHTHAHTVHKTRIDMSTECWPLVLVPLHTHTQATHSTWALKRCVATCATCWFLCVQLISLLGLKSRLCMYW